MGSPTPMVASKRKAEVLSPLKEGTISSRMPYSAIFQIQWNATGLQERLANYAVYNAQPGVYINPAGYQFEHFIGPVIAPHPLPPAVWPSIDHLKIWIRTLLSRIPDVIVDGEYVIITCPPPAPLPDPATLRRKSTGRALLRWKDLHVIAPFLFPFAFVPPPGIAIPLHSGFPHSCFGPLHLFSAENPEDIGPLI